MKKQFTKLYFAVFIVLISVAKSHAAVTVVTLGSSQTVAAAITANSTSLSSATNVLFVVPDGYTGQAGANTDLTGLPSSVKAVTFRGASANSVMKTNQINVSTSNALDSLNLRRLTLFGVDDGAAIGQYLYYPGTGTNVGILSIDSCTVKNYNGVIRTSGGTLKNISFNHSIIRNLGSYGFITYTLANTSGAPATITVTNSTFYDIQASMFYMNGSSYANVSISNSTFDNILSGTSAFYRPGTTEDLTISNCIFGKTLSSTSVGLYAAPATKTITGCYYSNDWVNSNTTLTTSFTPYNSPSTSLFTTPTIYNSTTLTSSTTGDYTIKDALFAGKTSAGDPRWYMAVGTTYTLTTSVSPSNSGTASPTSAAYNDGTSVSVTATKSVFGYGFKEWQDGSGNVVSSANPYTFTIHANTSLVAVFQPINTYDFTVNKTGTGATWGIVNLSPAPTNGKYEEGTSVTATIGSNNVLTFNQWENSSNSTTRNFTVNSNTTISASFTVTPFIVGWDFTTTEPRTKRAGDYYYSSANKGMFTMYENNGTDASWLASTISGYSCPRMWNPSANFSTPRYYQASFSTTGYKNILVHSKTTGTYHVFPVVKLYYSTDSISFTELNSVNITSVYGSGWADLNATLPAAANNQNRVYIRWMEDNTSTPALGSAADVDGMAVANIYITASSLETASAGDYIATKSGDISDVTNLSVSDGICVVGRAPSSPSSSTNVIIPAGITMTNSTGINCNNLYIRGSYTAMAPLSISGNLIMKSDAEGTGTIITNGNVSVSGTSTAQQYLKDARNWYLSSPMSNATVGSGYTCYQYDETGNHPSAVGPYWFTVSTGETFAPGSGYILLPNAAASTIEFTTSGSGTLNSGNVRVDLTRSGVEKTGFNLIGNPYPCHLNWTQTFVDNNSSLINPTIWYRTNTGTTNNSSQWAFLTYNAHSGEGIPSGTTGIVPPMQAFWVKAVASGALVLNSDLTQMHQSSNPLKVRSQNTNERMKLRLKLSDNKLSDETLIYFDEAALNGVDNFDSPKMCNDNTSEPEIFSVIGTEKLAINGLNKVAAKTIIPVGYQRSSQDSLTITATQVSNFDENTRIILVDNLLNKSTLLSEGKEYRFSTNNDNNTATRFSVIVENSTISSNNAASDKSISVYQTDKGINIDYPIGGSDKASVAVYTTTGQMIVSSRLTSANTCIPAPQQAGVYIIVVQTDIEKINTKLTIK